MISSINFLLKIRVKVTLNYFQNFKDKRDTINSL